jgi:hypothetical protein
VHNELYELIPGARTDVCTLGNGAVVAFGQFLDTIGEDREARLLSVLERLTKNGSIENVEIFRPVLKHTGLFAIKVAGSELACFRVGRKWVICKHIDGKLSNQSLLEAQFFHTQYLAKNHSKQNI